MFGLKRRATEALVLVGCLSAGLTAFAQSGALSPSTLAPTTRLPAFVDLDRYPAAQLPPTNDIAPIAPGWHSAEPWRFQVLPDGLIFDSYLAGPKESRFATHIIRGRNDNWLFEGLLGARVGLLRYGTSDPFRAEGWQIDAEGAGQVRLDLTDNKDVRSVDFRAGLPITYGVGRHRIKLAYYHLSSHLGDEFLLKNPGFNRLNFSRDTLVAAYAFYFTPQLRGYSEAGWAFYEDVSQQWEFQFGFDYAPCGPTGIRGAPFWAVNAHLREEVNFGGGLTAQAGWAWRGDASSNLLRIGLHYYNGESNQFSFFDTHEQQYGFGVWYDF